MTADLIIESIRRNDKLTIPHCKVPCSICHKNF